MMAKKLCDKVTVAAQIAVSDVVAIKDAGYTTLVCNRPDGEDLGQPNWDEIRGAAEEQGMATSFLPMSNREDALSVVAEFARVVENSEGPVFAYCRSGTRCEILWNMAQAHS
ncbi:TIGR01244 family sulfur transferase [Aliiroseovarius sp. KMU-50]|uniref:TIGR01244 family sulfur transferase n=1 Tax=Aliiroseovarius salicola TaxID=3009082 RepID=A0ABT4W1Z0_9RHOB|nr:TIGR01244 family sulfur transferase [Aliiroseovarius sp. KMU-50]MDA5094531.1 TIGR01244 family sulfur transferase [Aliiroseovarius sp. KMU-50]